MGKMPGGPKRLSYGSVLAGRYVIDPGVAVYCKSFLTGDAADIDADEQDSGEDLPSKAIVLDVWVDVLVAEATGTGKTLDVGLLASESGGDADGFLAAVDVSATGLVRGTLASGGQTLGALMSVDESGAGVLVPEPHNSDSVTAKSISFTASNADWVEFRGRIYVLLLEVVD